MAFNKEADELSELMTVGKVCYNEHSILFLFITVQTYRLSGAFIRRGELIIGPGYAIEETEAGELTNTPLKVLGDHDARIEVRVTQISPQFTYMGCTTCKRGAMV